MVEKITLQLIGSIEEYFQFSSYELKIIKKKIAKSVFYSTAFKEDLNKTINNDDYFAIAEASSILFLWISIVDDFVDDPKNETKERFLLYWKLYEESKTKFWQILQTEISYENFQLIWSYFVDLSFKACYRRQTGKLEKSNYWEMAAFILMTPYTLITGNKKSFNLEIPLLLQDNGRKNSFWDDWCELFKHSFNAKQIIDDIFDFSIDLENRTPTGFTDKLKKLFNNAQKDSYKEVFKNEFLLAANELKIAKGYSTKLDAIAFGELINNWEKEIDDLV